MVAVAVAVGVLVAVAVAVVVAVAVTVGVAVVVGVGLGVGLALPKNKKLNETPFEPVTLTVPVGLVPVNSCSSAELSTGLLPGQILLNGLPGSV